MARVRRASRRESIGLCAVLIGYLALLAFVFGHWGMRGVCAVVIANALPLIGGLIIIRRKRSNQPVKPTNSVRGNLP